ncbi:MAG: hypothetical protein JWR19_2675 [Pedosphaera sp.]|nr:hypothetical protein [Pedosphaera sp.]
MARKLRDQYPGAVYHVLNRGDRREPIFQADADRALFLATPVQACAKTRWQVAGRLPDAQSFSPRLRDALMGDPFTSCFTSFSADQLKSSS